MNAPWWWLPMSVGVSLLVGWGVQRWGLTGWGGKVSLPNTIFESLHVLEQAALAHALSYAATVGLTDGVYEPETDGWGAQDWGTSGFGGKVAL